MAVLTITTTTAQDAKIVAAFGRALGLGRNATGPEVKAAVINYIRQIVRADETTIATDTARATIVPIDPT